MIQQLITFLKHYVCVHQFRYSEMVNTGRDDDYRIKWPCAKCGKIFTAHAGYQIIGGNGGDKAVMPEK